jgi:hypothetical protein
VNMKWSFAFFKRQYSYLLAGLQSASHEGLCFMKLVFSNLCCPLYRNMKYNEWSDKANHEQLYIYPMLSLHLSCRELDFSDRRPQRLVIS